MINRLVKQLIFRSLAQIGWELQRAPSHSHNRLQEVIVGNFKIQMRSGLLAELFRADAKYSSQLGRLVTVTLGKYPSLQLIDVGANYGDTAAIARSAAPIPILCIEGDNQCFRLLQQNIQQFKGVEAYQMFLGEKTETIVATAEKRGWNMTIIPEQNSVPTEFSGSKAVQRNTYSAMPLVALDDFLEERMDVELFKVLKVDTEGFDCKILRGAQAFINRVRPVLSFEYNRHNMSRIAEGGLDTLWMLRDVGYESILIYDSQGRLLTATSMSNTEMISDLHEYANGKDGAIYYYDLCLFHRDDADIARSFIDSERALTKRGD